MNHFRYKVYYEYGGPTKSDPFRSEKSKDQIQDALDRVSHELGVYLADRDASIATARESDGSLIVNIETTDSDETFASAFTRCLNGLDLFGTRLP